MPRPVPGALSSSFASTSTVRTPQSARQTQSQHNVARGFTVIQGTLSNIANPRRRRQTHQNPNSRTSLTPMHQAEILRVTTRRNLRPGYCTYVFHLCRVLEHLTPPMTINAYLKLPENQQSAIFDAAVASPDRANRLHRDAYLGINAAWPGLTLQTSGASVPMPANPRHQAECVVHHTALKNGYCRGLLATFLRGLESMNPPMTIDHFLQRYDAATQQLILASCPGVEPLTSEVLNRLYGLNLSAVDQAAQASMQQG
jgi:hypothetical protein